MPGWLFALVVVVFAALRSSSSGGNEMRSPTVSRHPLNNA